MRKAVVAIALGNTGWSMTRAAAAIASGVVRWAQRREWELVDLRSWHWEIPHGVTVDGLIYDPHLDETRNLQALLSAIPYSVQVHRTPQGTSACGVDMDWQAVGLQAADYYLERGFRNFALAAYQTEGWVESLQAFKERIEASGGQCQAIKGMHLPDGERGLVRDTVREQLRELHTPLGIFCANDRLAVRLYRWCREEGLAVPEQAAILGFDDDTIACCSNPVPLSSVDPHYEQHGFEASRLLQRMIDGETIAPGTVIRVPPAGIVTRRSTDIMAVGDVRVAQALRYIRDHYTTNIGPDDVAAACDVPRRSLDRAFKKHLGKTLGKEIMRQRLASAETLLIESDMRAVDIAARVGFITPQYFNFQFRKHFGLTPKRYQAKERKRS